MPALHIWRTTNPYYPFSRIWIATDEHGAKLEFGNGGESKDTLILRWARTYPDHPTTHIVEHRFMPISEWVHCVADMHEQHRKEIENE